MFKESALANLFLSLAPIAVGLVMAILLPGAMKNPGGCARSALVFYGIGFASFAVAKIRNIKKGNLTSFGSSMMSRPEKWAYRSGYALMVLGAILTAALLVASKFNQ